MTWLIAALVVVGLEISLGTLVGRLIARTATPSIETRRDTAAHHRSVA